MSPENEAGAVNIVAGEETHEQAAAPAPAVAAPEPPRKPEPKAKKPPTVLTTPVPAPKAPERKSLVDVMKIDLRVRSSSTY